MIVVNRVDRLPRSLADFAKIVELFDTHNVSFVSVIQQFNTTTSMGRLTLNVTSERIHGPASEPVGNLSTFVRRTIFDVSMVIAPRCFPRERADITVPGLATYPAIAPHSRLATCKSNEAIHPLPVRCRRAFVWLTTSGIFMRADAGRRTWLDQETEF